MIIWDDTERESYQEGVHELCADGFFKIDFYGCKPGVVMSAVTSVFFEGQIEHWGDESIYRKFLPGEGELPVREWLQSIKKTGYNGSYSGEILNPWLWEQDHLELACKMKVALASFVQT